MRFISEALELLIIDVLEKLTGSAVFGILNPHAAFEMNDLVGTAKHKRTGCGFKVIVCVILQVHVSAARTTKPSCQGCGALVWSTCRDVRIVSWNESRILGRSLVSDIDVRGEQ